MGITSISFCTGDKAKTINQSEERNPGTENRAAHKLLNSVSKNDFNSENVFSSCYPSKKPNGDDVKVERDRGENLTIGK